MSEKKNLRLLVTAGPTREMIDPVRFISNVSTGEMGYAIAREAKKTGYEVTLISGPVSVAPPKGVRHISILSTQDLLDEMLKFWQTTDILIMAAAVCDYRPTEFSGSKIRRKAQFNLKLKSTPDILKFFSARKAARTVVGFALETEDLEKNAARKLKEKDLDLIIANKFGPQNNPFGSGKTSISIVNKGGIIKRVSNVSKAVAAAAILQAIKDLKPSRH